MLSNSTLGNRSRSAINLQTSIVSPVTFFFHFDWFFRIPLEGWASNLLETRLQLSNATGCGRRYQLPRKRLSIMPRTLHGRTALTQNVALRMFRAFCNTCWADRWWWKRHATLSCIIRLWIQSWSIFSRSRKECGFKMIWWIRRDFVRDVTLCILRLCEPGCTSRCSGCQLVCKR